MVLPSIEENQIQLIKTKVIETLEENDKDVKGVYHVEHRGELFSQYKFARGRDAKIRAVGLEMLTITRVSIAVTIKVMRITNVPELYQKIEEELKKKLKEIKYNLSSFQMKVIDLE